MKKTILFVGIESLQGPAWGEERVTPAMILEEQQPLPDDAEEAFSMDMLDDSDILSEGPVEVLDAQDPAEDLS